MCYNLIIIDHYKEHIYKTARCCVTLLTHVCLRVSNYIFRPLNMPSLFACYDNTLTVHSNFNYVFV